MTSTVRFIHVMCARVHEVRSRARRVLQSNDTLRTHKVRKTRMQNARRGRTSIGSANVKRAETINKAADTNTGLLPEVSQSQPTKQRQWEDENTHPFAVFAETFPVLGVVAILMSGAMNPPIRFSAEQRASPVPRCGAGNDSGV